MVSLREKGLQISMFSLCRRISYAQALTQNPAERDPEGVTFIQSAPNIWFSFNFKLTEEWNINKFYKLQLYFNKFGRVIRRFSYCQSTIKNYF
jgi:hypothetical protein